MSASVKVGSAWKSLVGVSVKVGGVWKTVTAAYTKVGGVWKQVYSTLTAHLQDSSTYATVSPVIYQFRADGYAYYTTNGGSSYTQDFLWKTGAGAASVYSLYAPSAEVVGSVPSGTYDTYLTLDTTRSWQLTASAGQLRSGSLNVYIVESANHANQLAGPGNVYLECDRS